MLRVGRQGGRGGAKCEPRNNTSPKMATEEVKSGHTTRTLRQHLQDQVQCKRDAWRKEEAHEQLAIATSKFEAASAPARSKEYLIARIKQCILEHVGRQLTREKRDFFKPRTTCSFGDLGMSEAECGALLPEVRAATGLTLSLAFHHTCAGMDPTCDPTCGTALSIDYA
jgi:hypothetical protein